MIPDKVLGVKRDETGKITNAGLTPETITVTGSASKIVKSDTGKFIFDKVERNKINNNIFFSFPFY